MSRKPPRRAPCHAREDITTQTQLQPNPAHPRRLFCFAPPPHQLLDLVAEPDHVTQPPRPPRKQGPKLLIRPRRLRLGEMHSDMQPPSPRLDERRRQLGNGAAGRRIEGGAGGGIAAEIDADDDGIARVLLVAEAGGEADGFQGGGEVVAAVDAEDQFGAEGVRGGWVWLAVFVGGDGVQDGADVEFPGEEFGAAGRAAGGAWGGAEFEVADAVCCKVAEYGLGCVGEGGWVGDEGVDVG